MKRKIALVTDSTCDLPVQVAQAADIHVIPQQIIWDGQAYRDGIDLTLASFYQRLATSPTLPVSAPPTPDDFAAAFQAARAKDEAEQVVLFTLSSKLSDSFHNALVGARLVNFPVFVHDSQTVSMGLGFAVLAAARARDDGANVDQILEAARQARRQCRQFFTVDTLEFLYRGGRIGGARHLIGTALSLRPILTIEDGQVVVIETVRTRQRAIARMLELAAEEGTPGEVQVAIMSGDADEEARQLIAPLRQRLKPLELIESHVSTSIGVNTGPGVLGITVCRC